MNAYTYFLDILKYTISGLIVFFAAFYSFRSYWDNHIRIKLLEFKRDIHKETLPLRLQAYERMVLLIDRINPVNLVIRNHQPYASAREFHQLLVSGIREEFQHNITQQIYLRAQAWEVVKKIKEDTIHLVNNNAAELPADAKASDLGKAILTHLSRLEENPYDLALQMIRSDLQELF